MSSQMLRRLLVAMLPLALVGCSPGMSDLEDFVAQEKAKKSKHIEPIPQIKQYDAFAYVPGDRRDPFVPSAPEQRTPIGGNSALQPDLHRNREPLEEFPLDGLRMKGTILANGRTYALIKAPDNVIHRVTRGDHMGQNYGTITQISDTEIKLTEIVPDGFGGWMQRPASISAGQ